MPPDYSQKKRASNNLDNKPSSRLEALEDKVYSPRTKEQPYDFSSRIKRENVAVRSEWVEKDQPKSHIPEAVSSRNTYAVLKQILIGSAVLFLASIAVAIYVFWGGSNIISTKNVTIGITVPSSVAGGEKLPVEVNFTNQNNVALLSAEVLIEYSDGAREPEDLSKELRRYREALGPIDINASVNKKYNVVFFGEEGEAKNVKVTLEYRVKGSNAIFSKTETRDLSLTSAPVSVSIESAGEVSAGDEAVFTVEIAANATQNIANPMIVADYPFGFEFTGSDPKPSYKNNVWNLGNLQPGSTRTIVLRGKFTGSEGEERSIRFIIGSKDTKDPSKVGVVFLAKSYTIMLTRPQLALNVAIDGRSGSEFALQAGAFVRGDIQLKNNLTSRIANVVIEARPKGTIFDRTSVTANNGFYRSVDNVIVWDQITRQTLAELAPGDSERVSFTFHTVRSALKIPNPSMTVEVTVSGDRMDSGQAGKVSTSVTKTIKIISEMALTAKLLHSSSPFPDTGPVPPVPEQETTYTVVLAVTNSTNDLSGVQVVTSLPIFTKWLGKISPEGSDLKYNELGGGLVWNAGELKRGATKEVYFQVSFTPSIIQAGSTPDLLDDISATGYDGFAGVNITAPGADKQTDISLRGDPIINGKGGPVQR